MGVCDRQCPKWKEGELELLFPYNGDEVTLRADLVAKGRDSSQVRLTWDRPEIPLADIFESVGHIPLPPYIDRYDEPSDAERYQTVYARHDGSVAAPTAGLHFTPAMLSELTAQGIRQEKITLHVGAGTFRPVSAATITDHVMHREEIVIHRELLCSLVQHPGAVIPVGTTSVRSIESVYWYGLRAMRKQEPLAEHFSVEQWEPYDYSVSEQLSYREVYSWLLRGMKERGITTLRGDTRLIIVPGYRFAVTNGLITNFHQPGSTLLMLVAALVGDRWKDAYRYALENDFRFLSYGDACLFL
jgi:S-adenosylmethionine:tRNA ribosyltransferase-isomerase